MKYYSFSIYIYIYVCIYVCVHMHNMCTLAYICCDHHGYSYTQLTEVPEGGWERLEGLPQDHKLQKRIRESISSESTELIEFDAIW